MSSALGSQCTERHVYVVTIGHGLCIFIPHFTLFSQCEKGMNMEILHSLRTILGSSFPPGITDLVYPHERCVPYMHVLGTLYTIQIGGDLTRIGLVYTLASCYYFMRK